MPIKRSIVIGDLHGCLEEFDELLHLVDYKIDRDRLFLTGDLTDRGPDSHGCIVRAQEIHASVCASNHDSKYVRYRKHEDSKRLTGSTNPIVFNPDKLAVLSTLTESDLDYLSWLPTIHRISPHLVVVHAGFETGIAPEGQDNNTCIYMRYVDAFGKKMKTNSHKIPPGGRRWSEAWDGKDSVIYGHQVLDLEAVKIDHPSRDAWTYGIDTGCAFGGHLTAMIFDGDNFLNAEFIKVKAKRAYVKYYSSANS